MTAQISLPLLKEDYHGASLVWTWAVGIFSLVVATAWAGEEMVANPYYKFWAGTKPGSVAVHIEKTKLSGPEAALAPDGVDEKHITYKLVSVDPERAIVEMVVTEQDFLGFVQSAPTRHIYPAKLKKSHVERVFLESGSKSGEETLTAAGQAMKCKTISGAIKETGGEQTEFKLWLCDDVPGRIAKQVRTARQKRRNDCRDHHDLEVVQERPIGAVHDVATHARPLD
jgi:hypothetical protein